MTESDPVLLCLQGRIAPEVAIARLLLAGESADGIEHRVRTAQVPGDAWAALAHAVAANKPTLGRVQTMIEMAGVDHEGADTPLHIAAMFDRAVRMSPEASVALYSLGNPETLAAATDEVVTWLAREGLFAPGADVLDLGCGIGRMAAAMAGRAHSVLGLDVAAGMVREACRRCAELENVRFAVTAGHDLSDLPTNAFDLLLAVDSFPYLVQAGVAERHFADAARVLREGGALVILNFWYRGDAAKDHADVRMWCHKYLFEIRRCGMSAFRLWDGLAYVFVRSALHKLHSVDRDFS